MARRRAAPAAARPIDGPCKFLTAAERHTFWLWRIAKDLIFLRGATRGTQARDVRLPFRFVPQVVYRLAKNFRGRPIFRNLQPVVHPFAVAPRRHQTRASQICQMARDFGLAEAQDLDKIADADFAARDQVQQAQARGVGERAKYMVQSGAFCGLRHERIVAQYIRLDIYEWAGVESITYSRTRIRSRRRPCMSGDIKSEVKSKYGEAAKRVAAGSSACCGSTGLSACDPITSNLYDEAQKSAIPAEAVAASLGCGNPTALAKLEPGEIVLDLGSGGGIDVLLSARRVAPGGKAYGLDMTDEMLELARENQRKSGVENVEFLRGEMENIPLPENSVDVVISNCVINLSGDKERVLREAFRVLRPGGRFAVSDVVVRGAVPADIRRSVELWVGCVAGAMEESEFRAKLDAAGFTEIEIEPTRVYSIEDARQFLAAAGIDADAIAPHVEGKFASAFIRARKPAAKMNAAEQSCCSPGCCAP